MILPAIGGHRVSDYSSRQRWTMTRAANTKKQTRNCYTGEFKPEALKLVETVGLSVVAGQLKLHGSQIYGRRTKARHLADTNAPRGGSSGTLPLPRTCAEVDLGCPCSCLAARWYRRAASPPSSETPLPNSYIVPSLCCAPASRSVPKLSPLLRCAAIVVLEDTSQPFLAADGKSLVGLSKYHRRDAFGDAAKSQLDQRDRNGNAFHSNDPSRLWGRQEHTPQRRVMQQRITQC